MALGDPVICPCCAEIAYIVHEQDDGMFYQANIGCDECNTLSVTCTRPTKVDTLTIKYPKPEPKGQMEFPFVEEEVKYPGKE